MEQYISIPLEWIEGSQRENPWALVVLELDFSYRVRSRTGTNGQKASCQELRALVLELLDAFTQRLKASSLHMKRDRTGITTGTADHAGTNSGMLGTIIPKEGLFW